MFDKGGSSGNTIEAIVEPARGLKTQIEYLHNDFMLLFQCFIRASYWKE